MKTTFRPGPFGQGRIADVVFSVGDGPSETIATAPDEAVMDALAREMQRRTSMPVHQIEKSDDAEGRVLYRLHFVGGRVIDITVFI
ncbi:hypothetical protein [Paraburkholderia hospita]|uniref:hypothetical protein n=1 Tax=Paraburkholderia hospita TaxID=169430 RepID=UPI001054C413|nr:hypothetical protein [Paraburkholderia hospita]